MCMSFSDLNLGRQEAVYLDSQDLAEVSHFWAGRVQGYGEYLTEQYAAMTPAELEEHAEIVEARTDNQGPVLQLIDAARKQHAELGAAA